MQNKENKKNKNIIKYVNISDKSKHEQLREKCFFSDPSCISQLKFVHSVYTKRVVLLSVLAFNEIKRPFKLGHTKQSI